MEIRTACSGDLVCSMVSEKLKAILGPLRYSRTWLAMLPGFTTGSILPVWITPQLILKNP